nr:HAD hydrolase-like protein [Candidatus Woesebacteria bacterium]
DVDTIRNMAPLKVLSYLGIPLYRLPQLILKGKATYNSLLSSVEPIPGIPFVLMELQKKYELHILTSNDQKIVLSFLNTHEISCFESVTSERNLFGKDKSLKKMFKQLRCSPEDVLYIGDEVRDIEACQKVNVDVCSVSWGLNSHDILAEHSPTYLLKDPTELLKLLI